MFARNIVIYLHINIFNDFYLNYLTVRTHYDNTRAIRSYATQTSLIFDSIKSTINSTIFMGSLAEHLNGSNKNN